ncbi:hypothetical protein VNO78_10308 [Psophocarpus tetragonolobus]|uniref:Phytocyanin domain-containing protein n=1 Tax=Psophocarpus tetragonolobus TaxID=3891 RepID=A0AAN9SJW5_PSOTE
MGVKKNVSLIMLSTIGWLVLGLGRVSSTTSHIVGEEMGWNLPPYPGFYDEWAKKRSFAVGDVLVFRYHAGLNTVVMVDRNDYEQCTSKNILRTFFLGNSSVTLEKPGDFFFFSSVGKHCEAGQKLHIIVPLPHANN